jgi:hypothetical protein
VLLLVSVLLVSLPTKTDPRAFHIRQAGPFPTFDLNPEQTLHHHNSLVHSAIIEHS